MAVLAALVVGGLGGPAAAPAVADVPAVYRVCAAVPWKAPTLTQQRRHLSRNARWWATDRADPGPMLDFPFIQRIRSGSISFDQDELGGMWTLGRRSARRLARCPFAGGPRRNYEVWLKGWQVTHVVLTDDGNLVADGHPAPGQVQDLHFPGYGDRDGSANRSLTLERTDAPGCAISSLQGDQGEYDELLGIGLSCADVRQLQAELDQSFDWTAPVLGFACAVGDTGYTGQRVRCADATGRTLRFGFVSGDV